MDSRPFIVCIVGPTACHKTDVSVRLAKRLDAEIVSADSVQVYRGMDVGSAKPDKSEMDGVKHHLIDCLEIDAPSFSVSQYYQMAVAAIQGVLARDRLPLVVGGSGLYINALTTPLNFAVPSDPDVREELSAAYDTDPEASMRLLNECDPATAMRLSLRDKKRIVRALEVYRISGKPLSSFGGNFQTSVAQAGPFQPILLGLSMEREKLYQRINQRVERMMQKGLVEEARRIYDAGYARSLPAMQSIGYRQLFEYFDGARTLEGAIEQIKLDTRRFAKRQLTWFKRDDRIVWFDATDFDESIIERMEATIRESLKQ